ncbi:hypothetical protein EXIGLDRAFT_837144 [Exidia glandulosa HHB12029]|uniref:Homeobox domain-containing protein n=1 Tax=Exidia glandulosa HHB12029 TaxID=1314781 RepID=A0A165H3V6_EXIGL|nr:hypothetical protein EXIGLDRAFT_837144 [Exidia glandulosa HHB12029]
MMTRKSSSPSATSSNAGSTAAAKDAKRTRRRLTPEQSKALDDAYIENPYPDDATRHMIANTLSMDVKTISVWFQNKRQADRKTALHNATSAANAGLAPPPLSMSIARPGRRHDSVGASRDRRNVKRPRTRNDIYYDDEDAGDATERERTSATPPSASASASASPSSRLEVPMPARQLERAASFSAVEPAPAPGTRTLARTASLPAAPTHTGPGFQGRTGLVYHVYPVPPPMPFYPPSYMGMGMGMHDAAGPGPAFYPPAAAPFSRTPSLVSTSSSSQDVDITFTPPTRPSTPPQGRTLWESMPSSSPGMSSDLEGQFARQGGGGGGGAKGRKRTLEWACARARVRARTEAEEALDEREERVEEVPERREKEVKPAQDEDETKMAAMLLCGLRTATR